MEHVEIIVAALFVAAAGLNVLVRWLDVPYPIPLERDVTLGEFIEDYWRLQAVPNL